MAKILGPDFIAFQVRDLEASRKFYTEYVGLSLAVHSPPDAVVFDAKPVPFAIRKPLIDLNATTRLGWGVSLWMACDDSDGLHAQLVNAGVSILSTPADGPFGRFFTFSDLDGYAITAHQLPKL